MSSDWPAPDTCGVKLAEFEKLAQLIGGCGAKLDELSGTLTLLLARAGAGTGPAQDIAHLATWARHHGPDLSRRAQLARDMDRQQQPSLACRADGIYLLLPDRFPDQVAQIEGKRAAALLRQAATGNAAALAALQNYANQPGSPYFARALLESLGPTALVELPAALATLLRARIQSLRQATETRAVFAMLARALTTSPMDDAFLASLEAAGRAQHPTPGTTDTFIGYQSLASRLAPLPPDTPLPLHFVETVGRDMVLFDRQRLTAAVTAGSPDYAPARQPLGDLSEHYGLGAALALTPIPFNGRTDFLRPLLDATRDQPAAQALLNFTPPGMQTSNLTYLLHDRRSEWRYTDHGATLGYLLQRAMSGPDPTSSHLFAETLQTLGPDILAHLTWQKSDQLAMSHDDKRFLDDLSNLRYPLATLLIQHLDEISSRLYDDEQSGETLHDITWASSVQAVIADVTQDDAAFTHLIHAQLNTTKTWLDHQYATTDHPDPANFAQHVAMLGRLTALRQETMRARAEGTTTYNTTIKNDISTLVGQLPLPDLKSAGPLTAAAQEIQNLALSELKTLITTHLTDNSEHTNTDQSQALNTEVAVLLVKQMAFSASATNGRFAAADIAGKSFARDGRIIPPETWTAMQREAFAAWCREHQSLTFTSTQGIREILRYCHESAIKAILLYETRGAN